MNFSDTIRHQDSDIVSDTSCLVSYILTRQRFKFGQKPNSESMFYHNPPPLALIFSFPAFASPSLYLWCSSSTPSSSSSSNLFSQVILPQVRSSLGGWEPWRQIYGGFACSSLLQICSSPTRKQAELTLDSALFVGFSIIKEIRRGVIC